MRLLISFLFVWIWLVSFSQMTFAEMKNIQKMDLNRFETYCLSNGYEFNSVTDDGIDIGLSYGKGSGLNTKYIYLYNKYRRVKKNVVEYQTGSITEYLSIKKELESTGFTQTEASTFNGVLFKEYTNDIFLVTIATGKHPESEKDFHQIILETK